MEFSAWYALAKGQYFIWFLLVVVLTVGICWMHYKKAQRDLLDWDSEQKENNRDER